jgi:uncharacterized membrane protein
VRYGAHRNFVDFGIFAQTAASAFGCFCNAVEGSHWGVHFSPVLYLAGAVVALWHSPLALIGLQAVAGALTIPPVYAIVRRRSSERAAMLAAAATFVYPALAGLTFADFHENGFAPAAVAWMLWAFDDGRVRPAVVFALVAIAVKEDQAIFVGIAASLAAWRFRLTMPGIAATFVAFAAFGAAAIFFFEIQPRAALAAHWAPVRFYDWNAGDVRDLFVRGLLERAGFFVLAFAPLAFLPFRSRMMWLAAAPLAEVLLSRMSTTYTLGSHYAGAWIGYVLVAFAFALRSLPEARAVRAAWACVALAAVELAVANPLHPGVNLRGAQARDVALDAQLLLLPPKIPIATQEEAYTHLALDNPNAAVFPEDPSVPVTACLLLADTAFPESPRLVKYAPALKRYIAAGTYRLVPGPRIRDIGVFRRFDCREAP